MDYTIVFDGGSRGNPGVGYGSYQIVRSRDGKTRLRRLEFPGTSTTNNEAEYMTLIAALEELTTGIEKAGASPRALTVEVKGDSQLVLKQLEGAWQVREPRLAPLRDKALALLRQFRQAKLTWQRRAKSVEVLGH
ncbi:MAG: ribonuclease HI family protein [Anaerolineae bacterium]